MRRRESRVEFLRRPGSIARMVKRMMAAMLAVGLTMVVTGYGSAPAGREPMNLGLLKREIFAYVASGAYECEVAAVAKEAGAWIESRAAQRQPGERLAVVFDLDETLWSGWQDMAAFDFGWNAASWAAWVEAAKAPAIEPVREVCRWARRLGVDVVFLTTRSEGGRKFTERNLGAVGCRECAALIMRPDGDQRTAAVFKAAERQRLTAEGRVIIANIGDQASDLAGGFAERVFKLPNPFYLTE